ncbi:MAG: hypothetical protein JNL12_01980 [Planctomycetes bacterium]|nr:hypothetical protein [Planctomycetota bacterium]
MHRSIEQVPLQRGAHPTRDAGMCAMEMVAWLAGEPHSDEPCCACPVLGAFVRACNDSMDDEQRNRLLKPLVPFLLDSRRTAAVERARGLVAVDHLVRTLLPNWLRRQRRLEEAQLLFDLPPVRRLEDVRAALRAVEHFARAQHAAVWVLQRALEGTPPARYVAGVVQVARALGDGATWAKMATLVGAMLSAEVEPAGPFAASETERLEASS